MDIDEVRTRLQRRRRELRAELEELTAPPEAGVNLSFGKRVGDGTTEAVERFATTATARSISRTLSGLERALAKLEEGTFGICDGCGAAIADERLEAIPGSPVCIECASGAMKPRS